MSRLFIEITIFSLTLATTCSYAAPPTANNLTIVIENKDSTNTTDETASRQEIKLTELKADTQSTAKLLKKEIDNLSDKIEEQEKRFEYQSTHIDQGLNLLGIFLGSLSLILTAAGVASYFTMHSRAEREAKEAANNWFTKNAEQLNQKIETLQTKLTEIESKAEEVFSSHVQRLKDGAEIAMEQMQEFIEKQNNPEKPNFELADNDKEALNLAASNAAKKSTTEMNFSDWNKLAFNAYAEDNKKSAIEYWEKALERGSDNIESIEMVLLNIAQTALDINDHEKSLNACARVINQAKESGSHSSKISTARAMMIEEINYFKLSAYKKAEEIHKKIEDIARESSDAEIQRIAYHSASNISVSLSEQKRYEEALQHSKNLLDELLQKPEPALPEVLSRANNSVAFNLICLAKRDWSDEVARMTRLKQAEPHAINATLNGPSKKIPQGNLIYCKYLMGATLDETIKAFQPLMSKSDASFYEATLRDFDIYPIPEVDQPLKNALIDLWRSLG